MKKGLIGISHAKFDKIIKKLKLLEESNTNLKIGNTSLAGFLHLNAKVINDQSDPKDIRTKRRILFIAGDFNRDPATLKPATQLKLHLHFNADQFTQLHIRLDELVKEYVKTAAVSPSEANNCSTVGDCVTMVEKKTQSV